MTATDWVFSQCPACRHDNSVELDGATRLCLNCRHEWNSATTTGPLATAPMLDNVIAPPTLAVVPDPPAVDGWANYLSEARSKLVGAKAVYHDAGAEGTITEITDDGFAVLEFGSGFQVFLLPNEFTVTAADVIPDEKIAALASVDMAIAAQVVRAGIAAIETVGDERRLTLAPDGWLPDDAGIMPVVEHGASYAVAIIAINAGISAETLAGMADELDKAAEAAKGASEQ